MDTQEKIFLAKILALKEQPYLRSIVSSMKAVMIDDFPGLTISVDVDWNLNYNPDFIDSLEVYECASLILHEAYHIVYNHSERFLNYKLPTTSHMLWNEAGDAVINAELIDSGVDFGSLSPIVAGEYSKYPHWQKGQATEEMFFSVYSNGNGNKEGGGEESGDESGEENKSESEQNEGGGNKQNDSQDSESSAKSSDESDENNENNEGQQGSGGEQKSDGDQKESEKQRSEGNQQGSDGEQNPEGSQKEDKKQRNSPSDGECGSIADGVKREWEGTSEEQQKLEEYDKTLTINKLTKDVIEAERHNPGTVPGGMFEQLNLINKSTINWRKILEHKIRTKIATVSGARNYTYSRPSRRSTAAMSISDKKIFMPAIRGYKNPSIAFVLDTSGSMDKKDLAQALGEIDKVVKDLRIRAVNVVQCDTAAHVYKNVKSVKDLIPHGRGGTNMAEGIKAVAESIKPTPDIIVIVTDGYTPWPKKPYPVLRNTVHIACIVTPKSKTVLSASDITSRIKAPNYITIIPVIF